MEDNSSADVEFFRTTVGLLSLSNEKLFDDIPSHRKISTRITFDSPNESGSPPSKKQVSPKREEYSSIEGKYNTCNEYLDIITLAENIVDSTIEQAQNILQIHPVIDRGTNPLLPDVFYSPRQISLQREYSLIDYERPQFTSWPAIEQFTIKLGASKINEYLTSFNTEEEWLYAIYYMGSRDEKCETFYDYKVTFNFESYRFKHRPDISNFNEEWLNHVLDSKINFFKRVKY